MRSLAKLVGGCAAALALQAHAATQVEPELQLLVEERYDDDSLLRVGGAGQLISKLSPRAGLSVSDPTFLARAFYAADLLLHHGTGGVSADHRGGAEAKKRLSPRAELSLGANLWRVTDPTSLPRIGLSHVLAPMWYGRLELLGRGDLAQRLEMRLGYRFEGARIDQPGRPVGLHHALFAEASFRLSRRSSAGLEGRGQLFGYGEQSATAAGAYATFRHRLTRATSLTARAGPTWYQGNRGEAGLSPRASLEVEHATEGFELNISAGQDLVGASGFDAALRAQYLSAVVQARLSGPLRAFAGAHGFRDGRAVGPGSEPLGPATAQGYGVGAGLEWRFSRRVSIFATADRFAEVGSDEVGTLAERNIVALRMVLKAP